MNSIGDFLISTPWWVYLIFILLVRRGISASNTRTVAIHKLFILPLVFLVMSIHSLFAFKNPSIVNLIDLIISFSIAVYWGFLLTSKLTITVDRSNRSLQIEGSWLSLFIILTLFSVKYFFGYSMIEHSNWLNSTIFKAAFFSTCGISSGLFLGRLSCYLWRYFSANSGCSTNFLVLK